MGVEQPGLPREKGVFEKVAEICIDSDENVVVNWLPIVTRKQVIEFLDKGVKILEAMSD